MLESNTIRSYQVTDRLVLRTKAFQHVTRSLAEKQALYKFWQLQSNIAPPSTHIPIFEPVLVGPQLSSVSSDTIQKLTFSQLTEKQKRYILPYLETFIQVCNYDAEKVIGHLCYLREFPEEQLLLQDRFTAEIFADFSVSHCLTYVPVQVIRQRVPREADLPNVVKWFNTYPEVKDTKHIPELIVVSQLAYSMVLSKVSPHLSLPYHVYIDGGSAREFYLMSEYPSLSLRDYMKQASVRNLDDLLVPIFTTAYTLYTLSLLNMYEEVFVTPLEGQEWVQKNIRAHELNTAAGYWTYLLPKWKGFSALQKFVPSFGTFWIVSDLTRLHIGTTSSGSIGRQYGILYYVIQSIKDELNRIKGAHKREEQTSSQATFESIVDPHHHSLVENVDDILHRLEHLQLEVSKPLQTLHNPLTYRKFLHHILFVPWDVAPGGLKVPHALLQIRTGTVARDCKLHNQLKEISFLENLQLDVFGWLPTHPLPLPTGLADRIDSIDKTLFPTLPDSLRDQVIQDIAKDAQMKASTVAEAQTFWDSMRAIRHLFLRDSYSIFKEGKDESWNPTIPRNGEIETYRDCVLYGSQRLDNLHSQDLFSTIETDILTRYFNIDSRNVTPEAKRLNQKVIQGLSLFGEGFARQVRPLILRDSNRLVTFDIITTEAKVDDLLKQFTEQKQLQRREEAKHPQKSLPKAFKQISQSYGVDPRLRRSGRQRLEELPHIEDIEKVFPDLIRMVYLLPQVLKEQIGVSSDETQYDLKREQQKSVFQLQALLERIERDQDSIEIVGKPFVNPEADAKLEQQLQRAKEERVKQAPIQRPQPAILLPTEDVKHEYLEPFHFSSSDTEESPFETSLFEATAPRTTHVSPFSFEDAPQP